MFLFQFGLCLSTSILYGVFRSDHQDSNTYILYPGNSVEVDSLLNYFTYVILLNTLIPISLVVTLELVKTAQSVFINFDQMMYSPVKQKKAAAKTFTLN